MYDSYTSGNTPPAAMVDGGGQRPQSNLVARLRAWGSKLPLNQQLVVVGILFLVVVIIALLLWPAPAPKPTVPAGPGITVGNGSQPAGNNGANAPAPNRPPAEQPAQNGQKKTTNGGGNGSASGSAGSGSSGGGSGGGETGSGDSGGSTCALPNYPNASCTGVPGTTTLSVVNGGMSINTANTIIEGKDIRGCVEVHAPGVIIRKSKISCDNFGVVLSHNDYSGTGLLLEDVEISCNDTLGTGVGDYNITVRRANIHSCQNGFDVDGEFTIEDSYIHDLIPYNLDDDPHIDGIQITPVGNNVTIRHNNIDGNADGNSAITSPRVSDGVVSNILIQDNLLYGGGYTLYCQQDGSGNNFRVINNHFSTAVYGPNVGAYAPWIGCQDEAQVTGNVYHESGQPVPL